MPLSGPRLLIPAATTPGQRLDAIEKRLDQSPARFAIGIADFGQAQFQRHRMVGPEAGIHVNQPDEAVQQQSAGHQANGAERDLRGDQQAAHPSAAAIGGAAAGGGEGELWVGMRRPPRGEHAKQHDRSRC
jgi:hypothetical protein